MKKLFDDYSWIFAIIGVIMGIVLVVKIINLALSMLAIVGIGLLVYVNLVIGVPALKEKLGL